MLRPCCLCLFLLCGAALNAAVVAKHDYDPVSDAVVSWEVDPGASIGQSITIPAGVLHITGFRVKLQRWGSPADLEYRLGTSKGASDLATGRIQAAQVSPWFEHLTGSQFQKPIAISSHAIVFLELSLPIGSSGTSSDHYEVFGTATAAIDRREFRTRFQYVASTGRESKRTTIFENPVNIDYGTHTENYSEGAAYDGAKQDLPSLDLAFVLYEGKEPAGNEEERFTFIEQITGPLFAKSIRDRRAQRAHNEIEIDGTWRVEAPVNSEEPLTTAVTEFRDFLRKAMDVQPSATVAHKITATTSCRAAPLKSEAFHLTITDAVIEICGYDARGLMQGLHFLEAKMRMRRAPFLQTGEETRAAVQSPRITSAPFYSRAELDVPVDQYTPGLLARMSRSGFNAIWIWGDLEDVGHSDIYPELNQGVTERQAKLRSLVERASRYGMDVYLQLANRPMPESFFARHPDVRGSAMQWYGGVNVLCTSQPEVREYFRTAVRNLMTSAPGLKGFVFIVGGEGFVNCWTRRNTCPRCSHRKPDDVIAEFSKALFEGARAGNSQAAVAAWPYSASNTWSKSDTTQSAFIQKLPAGMTLMTEFAKEGAIHFDDITIPAYDYPISIVGPSDRFTKQGALAKEYNLGFWVKTEHAIALEFIDVPYIPVFFQYAERFKRIREFADVDGQFDNWMHYGFTPSLAADVFYWNVWPQAPDANALLLSLARRDFGSHAAPLAVDAWRLFSEAIREYPFSGTMAMGPIQKGPAHPLFFDASYQPLSNHGRQFKNDLSWTRPWGPELAMSQLTKMREKWASGVSDLERMVEQSDSDLRPNAIRELGVGKALLAAISSALHVAEFYSARDELNRVQSADEKRQCLNRMVSIAEAEIQNAKSVLPFISSDSRLGYANSGKNDNEGVARGGIYTPRSIEKKIAQVERVLREEIPAYRRAHGLE